MQLISSYKKAIDENIIISITDDKGTIVYANNKFCEISKYKKSELIGQNHRIINSGVHSKDFFEHLWKTINNGKTWKGEIMNKAKDGTFYWVDTVILPVQNPKKVQYLSLRLDITKRKELEYKKEEYSKSIEDILYMISHEVRGPVSSILGLIEVEKIKDPQKDFELTLKYLKICAEELDKVTREMNEYIVKLKRDLDM